MKTTNLDEVGVMSFGNTLTQWGAIYEGGGKAYVMPFPGEPALPEDVLLLEMTVDEWERVMRQTDLVEVVGAGKAILRKGQRVIDSHISWAVWRRDGFVCRYCGKQAPLSVDHVDRWENGGATVPQNLITACKPCNKTRGDTEYEAWILSQEYRSRSAHLSDDVKAMNVEVIARLPQLVAMRVAKQRKR